MFLRYLTFFLCLFLSFSTFADESALNPETSKVAAENKASKEKTVTEALEAENSEVEASDKERAEFDWLLRMSLEDLLALKITTAGKQSERISEIPASVVIITRKDIERYGYYTLSEILENIPGLYAIDDYTYGKNFGVRGFWSGVANDNIIILLNGVHQVEDANSHYPMDKMLVPVESIDRIEVIRGPMSVLYGSGAFYGVINIITNEVDQNHALNMMSGSIGLPNSGSIGLLDSYKLFFRKSGRAEDFKYVLNASLFDEDGVNENLSKMSSQTPEMIEQTFGIPEDHQSTQGRMGNRELSIVFSGAFRDITVEFNHFDAKKELYLYNRPSYGDGTSSQRSTTNVLAGYKYEFADIFTFDGRLGYFSNRQWIEYNNGEDFFGIQQIEAQALEGELDFIINPFSDLNITVGLYHRNITNAYSTFHVPSVGIAPVLNQYAGLDDDIMINAFFTQLNYKPLDALKVVAGVRLEQMPAYSLYKIDPDPNDETKFIKSKGVYDEDEIEVIPRLALIYSVTENNIIKFFYGKANNRPSFYQNSKNSLDPTIEDLEPEYIDTLELNYIALLFSKVTLNASVFRNTLDNLITRVSEFDFEQGEYKSWSSNAGKMITNGAELTLHVRPVDNLNIELSVTYEKTEDEINEDIAVPYSPQVLGYFKVSYSYDSKFNLSMTGRYVDEMETYWDITPQDASDPDSAEKGRIGERVDSYFTMDANLRYNNLLMDGLYVNLRASNLLDQEIRYPTTTFNNRWADKGTIGQDRTFMLSLGFKF
ncbi:TonB-dependent receptor [candidate division CSSED10-310 bacterium]|uniref:TonB-dependent receptor n=1 Tax=candidate division CSSED10-310 bacterium TaxID=2855610 RepID=A0ABV6Z5C0_UNCC1